MTANTQVRIAIVCDNFSPHPTTKKCRRVADWAEANNAEIAYTPTNSSWLNRIVRHEVARVQRHSLKEVD